MTNKQNSNKRMILNAFDMNCVGHQNPGMWAHPDDQTHRYKDVDYWTDLAKLLERGGFDCLFIADVLGFYDVYGGSGTPHSGPQPRPPWEIRRSRWQPWRP